MAVERSPISWVANHRRHHRFSDRPGDPHSPHLHGNELLGQRRGFVHVREAAGNPARSQHQLRAPLAHLVRGVVAQLSITRTRGRLAMARCRISCIRRPRSSEASNASGSRPTFDGPPHSRSQHVKSDRVRMYRDPPVRGESAHTRCTLTSADVSLLSEAVHPPRATDAPRSVASRFVAHGLARVSACPMLRRRCTRCSTRSSVVTHVRRSRRSQSVGCRARGARNRHAFPGAGAHHP